MSRPIPTSPRICAAQILIRYRGENLCVKSAHRLRGLQRAHGIPILIQGQPGCDVRGGLDPFQLSFCRDPTTKLHKRLWCLRQSSLAEAAAPFSSSSALNSFKIFVSLVLEIHSDMSPRVLGALQPCAVRAVLCGFSSTWQCWKKLENYSFCLQGVLLGQDP